MSVELVENRLFVKKHLTRHMLRHTKSHVKSVDRHSQEKTN